MKQWSKIVKPDKIDKDIQAAGQTVRAALVVPDKNDKDIKLSVKLPKLLL